MFLLDCFLHIISGMKFHTGDQNIMLLSIYEFHESKLCVHCI